MWLISLFLRSQWNTNWYTFAEKDFYAFGVPHKCVGGKRLNWLSTLVVTHELVYYNNTQRANKRYIILYHRKTFIMMYTNMLEVKSSVMEAGINLWEAKNWSIFYISD